MIHLEGFNRLPEQQGASSGHFLSGLHVGISLSCAKVEEKRREVRTSVARSRRAIAQQEAPKDRMRTSKGYV